MQFSERRAGQRDEVVRVLSPLTCSLPLVPQGLEKPSSDHLQIFKQLLEFAAVLVNEQEDLGLWRITTLCN